jgi:methylmalonyl-CoA/ethylmalonyl-CoA epimerase
MTLPSALGALAAFEMDHIGIAVRTLDEGARFYQTLGFGTMHIETVADQKVRVAMLDLANHSRLELLEPTSADSPVQKFLDKNGPGIHHICLRVQNLRALLGELKKAQVRLIDSEPRAGAHNCQVAFVHPHATGGVLLELSEPGEPGGPSKYSKGSSR